VPRYPFAACIMVPDVVDLDWPPLERAARLTFSEGQRAQLLKALNRFIADILWQQLTPSVKDVTRTLESIHKYADALSHLLRLRTSDKDQTNLHFAVLGELPVHLDVHRLVRDLMALSVGTQVAITRIRQQAQRGRSRQESLRALIRAWHAVYRQAGGKAKGYSWSYESHYEGPFLDLLERGLAQAALACPAAQFPRSGLAQAIKSVIGTRRNPRKG
jgi:hypothetical protein